MLEIVDGFYADVFGVERESMWGLQTPTVHADVTATQVGAECDVLALRRHDTVRIIAPPDLEALLRDEVAARSAAEVFTAGFFNRVLDPHIESLIGPNWRGYVDQRRFQPYPTDGCARLGSENEPEAERLQALVGHADWQEGGFPEDGLPEFSFGRWGGGELVAAATLTTWRVGADDVGVVVAPSARGQGHGTAVVSAALAWALERTPVVQYRARGTNAASLAIAARLGFEHYLDNLAIQLRSPPPTGA